MKDLKYQKTVERIQAAVPSIMELKKFCFLKRKKDGLITYLIKERPWENTYQIVDWDGWQTEKFIREDYKIIGRDIKLEDCLIAIGEIKRSEIWECRLRGNIISIAIIGMGENDFSGWFDWQLNKPFHEQSDYTKDFIGNLLT